MSDGSARPCLGLGLGLEDGLPDAGSPGILLVAPFENVEEADRSKGDLRPHEGKLPEEDANAYVAAQEQHRQALARGGWNVDHYDALLDRYEGDQEAALDALGRTGPTAPRPGQSLDDAIGDWQRELGSLREADSNQ
jgi:hypothetical protein